MNSEISNANGLRGLACLAVVACHSLGSLPKINPLFYGVAKYGVWLFFVLSAYLLTLQLKEGMSRPILQRYAVRRFLRIYPLYAIALVLYLATGVFAGERLFGMLTLTDTYRHLWTIPVEVAFYVILPLIVAVLVNLRSHFGPAAVVAVVLLATAIHQIFYPYWLWPRNSFNMAWYAPVFVFGCAAAIVKDDWQVPERIRSSLIALIFAAAVLCAPISLNVLFGVRPSDYLMDEFVICGGAAAVLVWCAAGKTTRWTALFESRLLVWLGAISYPTYLLHRLMLDGPVSLVDPGVPSVILGILLSFAIGYVGHVLVERPLGGYASSRLRSRDVDDQICSSATTAGDGAAAVGDLVRARDRVRAAWQ